MPITTYLSDPQVKSIEEGLNDSEIQKLLDEINNRISKKVIVQKRVVKESKKSKPWHPVWGAFYTYEDYYSVLMDTGYDWQIINFESGYEEQSIRVNVDRATLINYLTGILVGLDEADKRKT